MRLGKVMRALVVLMVAVTLGGCVARGSSPDYPIHFAGMLLRGNTTHAITGSYDPGTGKYTIDSFEPPLPKVGEW